MARRRRSTRSAARRVVLGVGVVCLLALVGVALVAGSPGRLAAGTRIGGLDVGGLRPEAATALLEQRSAALRREPVIFVAGGRSFTYTASMLGVRPDWESAVRSAAAGNDGFAPLRGLRRIQTKLFGVEIEPRIATYPTVVRYTLATMTKAVDRPAVDAAVRRQGLQFDVTSARAGLGLDRARAEALVVASLADLERPDRVRLPLVRAEPHVVEADLADAVEAARTAVSAPVTLAVGPMRFRVERWRLAELLQLPARGTTETELGGTASRKLLAALASKVDRPPTDATFRVVQAGIELVPARVGRRLDVDTARRALQGAAFSPTARSASVTTTVSQPERTTAEAKAMGITGIVGSYTTTYGGTPGRIRNVGLVSELIDGALVAPGARFSFNETTGERNEAKGFEEAPVIINGELQNGIGGGVCQVSTTVFNAAFEAGLSIESRTNHALYIDHYPLGRDATVNYPDVDLVFRNDTDRWLLLRAFVGAGSLTVNLYGTPQDRRVETETAPLTVEGKVPWKRIDDPTLFRGDKVVEQLGVPPRSTAVTRRVYAPDGSLMYDTTWRSYYVGEPTVVRLGTKKRPVIVPRPKAAGVEPGKATPEGEAVTPSAAPVTPLP